MLLSILDPEMDPMVTLYKTGPPRKKHALPAQKYGSFPKLGVPLRGPGNKDLLGSLWVPYFRQL